MVCANNHAFQKGRSSSERAVSTELRIGSGWDFSCSSGSRCPCSHWCSSSYIPFWRSQMGSAFLRMNSSTESPSTVAGRLTRFCFPFTKIVMYSRRRLFFSAFSAGVSFRFRFVMSSMFRAFHWPCPPVLVDRI